MANRVAADFKEMAAVLADNTASQVE